VWDVLDGTERVLDVTTGEISDDTHMITSGITNLNRKIDKGLESLKDDIFHIHDRVVQVEKQKQPRPSRYYKYDADSESDDVDPTQSDSDKDDSSSQKEVFNISQNEFTYSDAPLVCKSYNADLASYDQVLESYHKGANWCNYGWSQNQMALYPIQEKFYDDLQAGPSEHRMDCGKPGINGGYFDDGNLKFGVNCYGVRPKADKGRLVYLDEKSKDIVNQQPVDGTHYSHHDALHHKLSSIKDRLKRDHVTTTPFSQHRWSQNSKRDSRYIMDKNYGTATVIENVKPPKPDSESKSGSSCQDSNFGCCRDGFTNKRDFKGSNCPDWNKKCQPGSTASDNQFVVSEEITL